MKKLTDEQIQKLFEEGLDTESKRSLLENEEELNSYTLLFDALATKPADGLSSHFSTKVVEKIESRKELKRIFRHYLSLAALILVLLALMTATIAYMDVEMAKNLLGQLFKYRWGVIFSLVVFLLVQSLDHVFIKSKMFKIK